MYAEPKWKMSKKGWYEPGEYERSVTVLSRLYAAGDFNVTEFRQLLCELRVAFNRVPQAAA